MGNITSAVDQRFFINKKRWSTVPTVTICS